MEQVTFGPMDANERFWAREVLAFVQKRALASYPKDVRVNVKFVGRRETPGQVNLASPRGTSDITLFFKDWQQARSVLETTPDDILATLAHECGHKDQARFHNRPLPSPLHAEIAANICGFKWAYQWGVLPRYKEKIKENTSYVTDETAKMDKRMKKSVRPMVEWQGIMAKEPSPLKYDELIQRFLEAIGPEGRS